MSAAWRGTSRQSLSGNINDSIMERGLLILEASLRPRSSAQMVGVSFTLLTLSFGQAEGPAEGSRELVLFMGREWFTPGEIDENGAEFVNGKVLLALI